MKYNSETQHRLTQLSRDYLKFDVFSSPQESIKDLIEVLHFHEYKYYVQDAPVISDYEYDVLYKKLESLENAFPQFVRHDSPTQRVSSDLTSDFPEVPHLKPMLSLENSYNPEDLNDFDKQVRKLTGLTHEPITYCVEPKYDGGTIVLLYENNNLVRAATRGNGSAGEEITNNARAIPAIPLIADFKSMGVHKIELRGEAIIKKSSFKMINEKREELGQSLFANPRNAATGGLRVKDNKDVKSRAMEAFIYQVSVAIDEQGKDCSAKFVGQFESINTLDELGFKVPTIEKKLCTSIEEVIHFCQEWESRREEYDYEIDGMVVKVNDFVLQEQCGSTAHHPRWAVAYKFKAKQATSKLHAVEFQVGKTGAITPVAKIDPVPLAGVTVSSISMHNEDFIVSKDLRIFDTVLVERAGDVIPYIVKSFPELRTGDEQIIHFPTTCPSCQSELNRAPGESAWRCVNSLCPAQSIQKIIHHVSKDGMDIEGFGKSYVERFAELGWLSSIADVYRLNYESIALLEGFGQKSAQNLQTAIEKAKSNPISRLLQSLSIHHLGKKASKLIAENVKYLFDLEQWVEEDYTRINEIGPVLAQNMIQFFSEPKNLELLRQMEMLGVNMQQTAADAPIAVAEDGLLSQKTILFTGSLVQMSRTEAQKLAADHGAKNISAVSSNLDYLVVGEKAGSKLKKAQAIGTVTILTEEEFYALIRYDLEK